MTGLQSAPVRPRACVLAVDVGLPTLTQRADNCHFRLDVGVSFLEIAKLDLPGNGRGDGFDVNSLRSGISDHRHDDASAVTANSISSL